MPPEPAISVEQLAAFLAQPVPRRNVPPAIRRAALGQALHVSLAYVGGLFGSFGMIFVLAFTPWNYFQDVRLKNAPTVEGRVESVNATAMSVRKRQVTRYQFSFQPPSSGRREGTCFTTGKNWSVGDKVSVQYLPGNPEISRIEGSRKSKVDSLGPLFTWIFPAIGYGLAACVIVSRRRVNALLERGAVGEAQVTSVTQTVTQINDLYVYEITLERAGQTPSVISRHNPGIVSFARDRLESKQPVFVLFNPANPKRALMPETFLF